MEHSKVIGFIAYVTKTSPVCFEDALLIAESEQSMLDFVKGIEPNPEKQVTIRKYRFEDILAGLQRGNAFAFNRESYGRFYPVAKAAGIPVENVNFDEMEKMGNHLFVLQAKVP